MVSQANTAYRGIYRFAGTASTTAQFFTDPNSRLGIQHDGNGNGKPVAIGANYSLPVNVPRSQMFQPPGNGWVCRKPVLSCQLRGPSLTAGESDAANLGRRHSET